MTPRAPMLAVFCRKPIIWDNLHANGAAENRNGAATTSDFHLPGTYRGGLVARLQQLLVQRQDGAFFRSVERTTDEFGTEPVHTI